MVSHLHKIGMHQIPFFYIGQISALSGTKSSDLVSEALTTQPDADTNTDEPSLEDEVTSAIKKTTKMGARCRT